MHRQNSKTYEKARWIFSHRRPVYDRVWPKAILQDSERKKETEILQ